MGYRFRLHRKDLPGKPDIVLPRHNTIIFVHGCFWHQHKGCKYAYLPKTKQDFWIKKLNANADRDKSVIKRLKKSGWRILIIWECETKEIAALENTIRSFLKSATNSMPFETQKEK